MKDGRSSVSNASSYQEMADYWDEHDLDDAWDPAREVSFEVDIDSERLYYSLDRQLSKQMSEEARRRGVSSGTLLNLWVQEKLLGSH